MGIKGFDHVALPIENVASMLSFYRKLGFTVKSVGGQEKPVYSVTLGHHRFNFHSPKTWKSKGFLRALTALPGSGDFCFEWEGSLEGVLEFLCSQKIRILHGPVSRTGGRAQGNLQGQSVYFRDPDSNLIEIIVYPEAGE